MAAAPAYFFEEYPKQRQFAEAVISGKYKWLYYGGAIRGGKSYCVMAVLFALCKLYPGSRWAIVRKDLPTLRRNILPVFRKLKPPTFTDFNQSTWEAYHENGSCIILFPESHAGDKGYNRWQGLEVNGFWLEEANELQRTSWDWALQRAGSYLIPRSQHNPSPVQPLPYILLTSNPAGNWVKRLFYTPWKTKQLKPPFFYLPATIHDNPGLPQEYLDSLENLPDRDYQVYVMGNWDLLAGQALEELDRDMHLIKNPFIDKRTGRPSYPDHMPIFGGFDWGYRHPFSFGTYIETGERILCLETIRGRGMADAVMIDYITEVLREQLYIEPSRFHVIYAGKDAFSEVQARMNVEETTAERFARAGYPMIPASTARISGLKNFREMTAWQKVGRVRDPKTGREIAVPGVPRFAWIETPSNSESFEQCANMILDPERPEDVLKVNADENGEGGDDDYDQHRYALQSRAKATQAPAPEVGDDEQRPVDWKKREIGRRRRTPAELGLTEDDDLRVPFRVPRSASTQWRAPRPTGHEIIDDERLTYDQLEDL